MPVVTKCRCTLKVVHIDAASVVFGTPVATPVDDPFPHVNTLSLTRSEWEEMGKPKRITVTVEPGDLLNPGEEYAAVTAEATNAVGTLMNAVKAGRA